MLGSWSSLVCSVGPDFLGDKTPDLIPGRAVLFGLVNAVLHGVPQILRNFAIASEKVSPFVNSRTAWSSSA